MALQHPTLRGVRVRTVDDARHIFYAVHQRRLPIITRRLSTEERLQIRPGDVYVWEEKTQHSVENSGLAIERWTDCFGWGPSRVRDDFLFYTQKEREQKRTNNRRNDMPPQSPGERWHKQTISMLVRDPSVASSIPRKWHMTAYFYQEDLPDVTHCVKLHGVPHPPNGMFERTKTRRDRGNNVNAAAARAARASSSDSSDDTMAGPSRHDVRQKRTGGRPAPYAASASIRSMRDVSPALSSVSSATSHYHSNLPPMSASSGSSGLSLFDRPTLPPLHIGSSFCSEVNDHRYGEPPVSTFTNSRQLPHPSSLSRRTPEYMMSYEGREVARPILGVPLVQTYRTPRRGEDDAVLRKFT
ncbi:Gti1/Pac2 family-domain-containing protein [Auriculariales sp. MPI-PUGE-AT-0066]|nr:Gti1/Pac2 family-domain-containing protein [Auriculariales sp. MPI-PUGE-AT-0066]